VDKINNNFMRVLVPGVDKKTSLEAVELARDNPGIYAAVGIHPQQAEKLSKKKINWFKKMLNKPEVVALGEVGLDYYHEKKPRIIQKQMLAQFIKLARKTAAPLLVHLRPESNTGKKNKCRRVFQDIKNLLIKEGENQLTGIFHCFAGNRQEFESTLKYRFFYSTAANILFNENQNLKNVFAAVPVDRLLVETDSPYMSPPPDRGKQNNPFTVKKIIKVLSKIHSISPDIMADKININAARIFNW